MKNKLPKIGLLVLFFGISNAQVLTYVGSETKLYVKSGTLFYSGGDFQLNSNLEKAVENRGNITILGNYQKGISADAALDGKEFVNVYTSSNDYGQVKILGGAIGTNARMTVQRPAASSTYFNSTFPIAFPFNDSVSYLMNSFGMQASDFKGSCAIGVNCGNSIYDMTLRKWNNNLVVNDVVPTESIFKAGDYYLLNLRDNSIKASMNGIISYKGIPSPEIYVSTAKGVINGYSEADFSNFGYNTWKEYLNQYREKYKSYLGDVNTTNAVHAKNTYRFGNPYTSNLDLSAFDGANAWLKIKNNGVIRTLKQASDFIMIKNFYITKRTTSYGITWNPTRGSQHNNTSSTSTYYKALFDGVQWIGDAQALLIRPFETFNLNFPLIDKTKMGNTRILDVEVNFNDAHKTFSYTPGVSDVPVSRKNSLYSSASETSSKASLSNIYNFYQAEIFLVNNETILGSPTYLVGANYNTESAGISANTNDIFAFGISPGTANIAYDSKKDFNTFNTDTYIGKPLGIGFNNLVVGNEYELRFNLYEGSIFNEVKELSTDKFYLLDKEANKVTEITAAESYKFVVSNNDYNLRFEVYWKSYTPQSTLAIGVVEDPKKSTYIYFENGFSKIRFEKSGKANVQIYEMSGKLVNDLSNITTANDYTLELERNKVYVIIVKYNDGTIRKLKTIK